MNDLRDLYQELILEHSRKPRNFGKLDKYDYYERGSNPLCGDQYELFIKCDDRIISDISFSGSGCAISQASASVMTDVIKGKSIKTAQDYINGFSKVITNGEPSEGLPTRLQAFAGVHNFPVRVKCAILPWRILEAVIKKIEHLKNNNS